MILLYKGKSWISKLIKWQTFGQYSHAAWWCHDKSVIEAWHKGGVSHSATPATLHKPGTEIDVFSVCGVTDDGEGFYVEQLLKEEIGSKYDFAPVLRGFPLRLNRDNPNKWFCSELVFSKVREREINLLRDVPAFKVHPTLLSYSPLLRKVGTITTIDANDYDFVSVDAVADRVPHSSNNPPIH